MTCLRQIALPFLEYYIVPRFQNIIWLLIANTFFIPKVTKFSMYEKSVPPRTKGSPDQVEGQPVSEEGLAGDSCQSQVELRDTVDRLGTHASIAAHREHTVKYITSDGLQARPMQ